MATDDARQPESPFLIERLMRHTLRQEEAVYESEEDFRDAVAGQADDDLVTRRLAELADDPQERAQDLAYQAYEAEDGDLALELAEKALALDADNCDALTVRAFLTCEDAGDLIAELERAASCGERRLGEEFFAEFMGDFWPMVEARPYMRTIKQLAEVMWEVGRRLDAVELYENLLELDPVDHMGNGMLLVGSYLAMGEIQRAWDLLEDLDDDGTVASWAWVLLLVLTGDDEAARDSLHHAMQTNPYVAPWFVNLGDPDIEPVTAPVVAPGSEDEALVCADLLGEGWLRSPDAQWWLHDVLVELGLLDDEEGGPDAPGAERAN
jgi:tetratricopeptide (TPR) repeat protein